MSWKGSKVFSEIPSQHRRMYMDSRLFISFSSKRALGNGSGGGLVLARWLKGD
jgi:hypothetical protein